MLLEATRDYRAFHHIIWQPTFTCDTVCLNCYVACGELSKNAIEFSDKLYRLVFITHQIACGQFTLSFDNTINPNKDTANTLKLLLQKYDNECSQKPSTLLPQLSFTFRSIASMTNWAEAVNLPIDKFLANVSILSISMFQSLDEHIGLKKICRRTHTILNYNCMVSQDLSKKLQLPCHAANFLNTIALCDQTYLHLCKGILGESLPSYSLEAYNIAKSCVGAIRRNKVVLDQCKYKNIKLSCDAGISTVCVWPNDIVTGCPYDSNGVSQSQGNTLLERLINVTSSYSYCKVN